MPSALSHPTSLKQDVLKSLSSDEQMWELLWLWPEASQEIVDIMASHVHQLSGGHRGRAIRFMAKICERYVIIPTSIILSTPIRDIEGLRAVKKWIYTFGCMDDQHCLILRPQAGELKERSQWKEIYKQLPQWICVEHRNIVPLLGVSFQPARSLWLVIKHYSNGLILEFLKKHPKFNRVKLLLDIATGLRYMHGLDMVYNILQPTQIYVDDEATACIANAIELEDGIGVTGPLGLEDTIYTAPEVVRPPRGASSTQESDVYAFGMVAWREGDYLKPYIPLTWQVLQLFSDSIPYESVITAILKTQQGERPGRPDNTEHWVLGDTLWDLICECWDQDSNRRPTSAAIVQRLEAMYLT